MEDDKQHGIPNPIHKKIESVRSNRDQRAIRQRAEQLVRLTQTEISEMAFENVEAIVHELQVHQIELELQNEELRESQLALAQSHDRYLDLFDFAPVGYVISDQRGQIYEANLTAANMLRLPRGELVQKKLPHFASNSGGDQMHCFFQAVFSEEKSQCCEMELIREDGNSFIVRLESIVFNENEGGKRCRTALIDITKEREAKKWQEQAERLRGVVENLPAGAIFVETDGRIFLNRNAEEITGYTRTDLNTVTSWFRRLYPGQVTQVRELYEASRSAGFPELLSSQIRRKNGCVRHIEFAAHKFGDHEIWLVNDITARREAEEMLEQKQSYLKAILTTAADAIFTIDADGFVIGANPAAEKMFSYQSGSMVGVTASAFLPDLHRVLADKGLCKDPETGEIQREVEALRKDCSTFYGELSISEVNYLGIYTCILRDISQRKLSDEVLRERRELSEKLIENAPNIVLVLDLEGRIVRVNPTFEKLTGRKLPEIEGKFWLDNFIPERNREKNRTIFLTILSRPAALYNYTDPIIAQNSEERYISWNAAHLTDANGINIGLLCTGHDITDRLRLEGEVLTAVEEDRRRIAQDLHDGVGSQLVGINFHLGALKTKIDGGMPLASSEIESISTLVADAINQSRDIAQGIHPIGSEPEELMNALKKLTLRITAAHSASCQFHCESRVEIDQPVVANHLYRIVQEAVNNAVKHSGAQSITVSLDKKDDQICVVIVDDGSGFDTELQDFQGLGLHIMNYRTRAISGTLTIEKHGEAGTKITCSVPVPALP
ncbi:MAG: PAS domain S-box protein [Verrucomicrobiales bacterium]|nr:PAS domain S-box protein [Verrucomicrobiales bacterium]